MDDELAETVAGIILGQGYAGAQRWKDAWREVGPENLQQIFATLAAREDIHDRLGEIDVPALVIHGDADVAISLAVAQRLVDGLPHAELAVVEGAGHASNLTHPEAVNPHIEGFLERLSA